MIDSKIQSRTLPPVWYVARFRMIIAMARQQADAVTVRLLERALLETVG